MLAAIVGLLLILTIAIGFLGLIAAPQLRSGKRILAPGGERVVATAAAAPVAAGRGTLRGLIASWRASIATAQWFQRIWHPVSEAIHGALDRLEDRDVPADAQGGEARPAVVGAADLTARMGHSQPRGHTRSATAAGGRVHPASAWLGKTGEIPLRDIAVPSDPLPSDDGDRPFAAPFAEAEITRPMAPVPGAVPAPAGARSNTRGPLPSTGGISTPGLAAAAASGSPKKTDAKKSVVQPQPVSAKVGAEAPAARTGGRAPEAPAGRSTGGRAPSADAPGSAATAAAGAAARASSTGSSSTGSSAGTGSAGGQGGTSAPRGPRRDRFDVAAIVGNRGRLREAARIAVERLDPKPEPEVKAEVEAVPEKSPAAGPAPVAPSDETVMIQPVKAPSARVPVAKKNAARPAPAAVAPSDETVMIQPVRAPIAAADEVVRFAPIKEPVARSSADPAPVASVDPSDETVKIEPVREPVAKAEPAVAPSDATVLIPPVVEPKAAAEKAAAEKAAAEKAAAEKAAAEKAAAEKAAAEKAAAEKAAAEKAAAEKAGAQAVPPVAPTMVMEPVREAVEREAELDRSPAAPTTSTSAHAETEVIDAIDAPVASDAQAAAKARSNRSRGKKPRGGKVRNGR